MSLSYEGRRSINEIILTHPARRLYLLIERYKREFPRGTPIVCACEEGRMDDVELFMNLHPFHKYITNRDVNGYRDDMTLKDMVSQVGRRSSGGEFTPLMQAADKEHFQIVKCLIELLLAHMSLDSINKKTRRGSTPLDFAYDYNHSPLRQEIIALLRSKGGKANCYDVKWQTCRRR